LAISDRYEFSFKNYAIKLPCRRCNVNSSLKGCRD